MSNIALTGGGRSGPRVLPSYWLTFDGSDDYIVLPDGEGDEPTTALFVEAWVKDMPSGASRAIVTRGNWYDAGYCFGVYYLSNTFYMDLRINGTGGGEVSAVPPDTTLPIHVAAGWDGSKIYYFVQGILVAEVDRSATLSYSDNNWAIGNLLGAGGLWHWSGKLTQLRVSNVCRHTTSFTPPTMLASDANTAGLWLCREGSGTSIADAGPGSHAGTFKGSGEPAWGTVADLNTLSYGDALWAAVEALIPAVTGTNVYLHRTNANQYEVYRKVHATGPYWAKWVYARAQNALLTPETIFTGIPDPANDTPSGWSTGPATRLTSSLTEYALFGTEAGSVLTGWGGEHGYETMDAETWYVDSVATVLADDGWANGSEVKLVATGHYTEPNTTNRVCNVTKTHTHSSTVMYLDAGYEFAWLINWEPNDLFTPVAIIDTDNLPTVNHSLGGTDRAISGAELLTTERTHACAAWKADTGAVLGIWFDFDDALLRCATHPPVINQPSKKLYLKRGVELHGAQAASTWAYHARFMPLDNCGNHILKTT